MADGPCGRSQALLSQECKRCHLTEIYKSILNFYTSVEVYFIPFAFRLLFHDEMSGGPSSARSSKVSQRGSSFSDSRQ